MAIGMKVACAALAVTAVIGWGGSEAWADNPCGAGNPCGVGNPCAAGPTPIRRDHVTDKKALLKRGKALWESEKLGESGLSCMTCHADHENLNLDNAEPWPRHVKMTKDIVTLDQMINYCVINPIAGKPLDPNGIDMTAMNAWYREYVKKYRAK
jgi:hypothetical protein